MRRRQWFTWRRSVVALSCICLIAVAAICFMTIGSRAEDSGATAITHGFATNNLVPSEEGEKGTATNPLVLLELVPDMKFTTIGYLIKGCEPVDVNKMVQDAKNGDTTADNYLYKICRSGVADHAWNVSYEHKNAFLKNVVQVPDDKIADYHVVVKTITPGELNANSQWADRADLVFVTNKTYDSSIFDVYQNKKYLKFTYNKAFNSTNPINFSNNDDLNWKTVMKLFKKIAIDEDQAGIIIDQSVFSTMYNNGQAEGSLKQVTAKQIGLDGNVISSSNPSKAGSNNNVFKLCLMLNTMNPQALYNMFLYDYPDGSRKAAVTEGTVNGRTTGVFNVQSGDAKTYWNDNTFMPPKLDGSPSSGDSNDWTTGECYKTYETKASLANSYATVNSHVYVFQSDMSMLDDLANEAKVTDNNLTKELFAYIKEETGNTPGSTSPATAIAFIMGLKKDSTKIKDSINILDLEPCTISSTLPSNKSYLTEVILRTRIVPFYIGKVNIVHQSSSEFIGKIEDLNSTYDLIYMGLYYGRLNINNGWPAYNDTSLNKKIYLHVGDKIVSRQEGEYNVNWPNYMDNIARGPGNDITKLKQGYLKKYLDAGLPIVADSDLYDQNTTYIDKTSYIYKLFNSKSSYGNLLSSKDSTLGFKVYSYFKKSGLILHVDKSPKEYEGNSTDGTIDDSEYINRTLSFGFTLEDSEYIPGNYYTAKLYVDYSRDGHFSSDEVVQSRTGLKADKTYYTLSKQLSKNYIGAIPWKLVVSKDDNTEIRDMQQGFSAIKRSLSEKKQINVLQITDRKGSSLNLQKNVENNGLFKKYTANLNDYIINFTTIDNVDFANWYTSSSRFKNNATEEEKAAADKLSQYNMLIFGFADYYGNISNQYGALDNVIYYINSGRSVLMTHDVTSLYNVTESDKTNSYDINGYNFNVLFRDYLGMDRFGVRTTDSTLLAAKDTPTAPDGSVYKQKHGYTYQALARLGAYNGQYSIYPGCGIYQLPVFTSKASKLNGGQITQYPYLITDDISIADTHSQYYQLDMENEDIVVWYTLAQDGKTQWEQFSCSANDASNNYYIYSKGNVTYSGVGQSDISNNDMEVRLFVNTMIAAYANVNDPPTVEVVSPGVYSTADHDYSMYVSVDYAETSFSGARYEDVAFVPKNNSLVSEDIYVKVTTADDSGLNVYDESDKLISPDTYGYVKLLDSHTYHLKWPQEYLAKPKKMDINFFCYYTEKSKPRYGAAKAHLMRRNLFDLD